MFFRSPARWISAFAAALAVVAGPLRADEFVTVDFPMQGKPIVAAGLAATPRQVTAPDGLGYTEVLLRPIRKETRVFLTFIFQENGGKGPAVFWSGDVSGRQITITDNLAEGVVGLNRRTVALPAEVSAEAGRLYVMGRQDWLLRLRIDWCEPSTAMVAADQERPALIAGGAVWLDRETTGQAPMTPPDVWFGPVLDAALQDGAADLSESTEFVVPLKGATGRARLRAKFLGLPLGKGVRVWVNGKLAGRMQPTVPGLTDAGFVRRDHRTTYAGWREGALFLDEGKLTEGKNSIVLESPGKGVYVSGTAIEIETAATESAPEEKPAATPAPLPTATPVSSPKPTGTFSQESP
jgi:hypothetical protein